MSYLDNDGLSYFWSQLKSMIPARLGTYTGSIDTLSDTDSNALPARDSVCSCRSSAISGTLPFTSSSAYTFILETKKVNTSGNLVALQRATVYDSAGKYKIYTRMYINSKWNPWGYVTCTASS
jgi:hypothetical protein